ncbi:hypothetical protein [Comamonas jiangduensis]|uniref:Uncharacterized protein n=1 Tax=Comamonas jiangduensis TaxID=1194168 RepID=A0ABV4IGC1_9BURK
MNAYAFPPLSVRTVEVVLVESQRGEGDLRREVLQVYAKTGDLLAEHDRIHWDPVYASYALRDQVTPEMLRIWGDGQPDVGGVAHG